jgi:hypothetical protein
MQCGIVNLFEVAGRRGRGDGGSCAGIPRLITGGTLSAQLKLDRQALDRIAL